MTTEILKRIGSLVAYLGLAFISCRATEHSFHLLMDNWMPEAFVWLLTIAFFIVASYGTKMFVDALNYDDYMDHRRRNFWIGIVLVVVFWLFMSMPTNTHTFFYNQNISEKVQEDISTTTKYLEQIKDRQNVDPAYNTLHDDVNKKFTELTDEFNGIGQSGKSGGGEYVRQIMRSINAVLEKELPGSSIKFMDDYYNVHNQAILTAYENSMNYSLERIKDKNYKVSTTAADEASEAIRKLKIMNDTIKTMSEVGDINEDIIKQTNSVLVNGYTCVKNNQKYVKFTNDSDKQLYTAANIETRTKRMLSVIDVWVDFFHGKYPLVYLGYVLLSILVDVAAFMFFNFAFKKNN